MILFISCFCLHTLLLTDCTGESFVSYMLSHFDLTFILSMSDFFFVCTAYCLIFLLCVFFSLRVRVSTWNRLNLLKGGVLSSFMRQASGHDPAYPVLTELHLAALDRRLSGVIATIRQCIELQGAESTLIEDRMNLPHP